MIDIAKIQTRLLKAGYSIGTTDGIAGPMTWAGILAYVAQRPMNVMLPLGKAMATHAPKFGLLDTVPRFANFIGQACHESGGFRYLKEIWGPTDTQRRYEGRKDLGNTEPGDGFRYRGRGIFQITGRANYREMGMRSGLPLIETPELAEEPDAAVLTACIFWQTRKLSLKADAGREDDVTRWINGGENGISERRKLVARAKTLTA